MKRRDPIQDDGSDPANGIRARTRGSTVGAKAETAGPEEPQPALSAREAGILAFERQWWKHAGAKEEAIRAEFGLSAARYYQMLNAVLDSPAALVSDPMLVKRLRRLRDSRTAARSARVVGTAAPINSTQRDAGETRK